MSREAVKVLLRTGGSDSNEGVRVLLVLLLLLERRHLTAVSFRLCVLFCCPSCPFPLPVGVAGFGLWQSLVTCSWRLPTTCTRLDWTFQVKPFAGTRRSAWSAILCDKRCQMSSRLSSRLVTAVAVMVRHQMYVRLGVLLLRHSSICFRVVSHSLGVVTAGTG